MQGTHDTDESTMADGDGLDPGEAARLLEQTKRDAKRQFDLSPPWVSALMGAVILVAYGAALAVVAGGVVAAFVGPSAAWLAAGIALFVGVVGYAAATAKPGRA